MSLRVRLALWSTGILAVTLVVFASAVYLTVQDTLLHNVDKVTSGRAARAVRYLSVAERPPYLTPDTIQPTIDNFTSADVCLQVVNQREQVVARSRGADLCAAPVNSRFPVQAALDSGATYTASTHGVPIRLYVTALYTYGARRLAGYLVVIHALSPTVETLRTLRDRLVAAGLVALLLAGGTTLALAGRALRPIAALTRAAREITSAQKFGQRVPHAGPRDEVGQLAVTFNDMLASLESTYTAQRRFLADASHELRAPLTIILGNAEALARAGSAPAAEQAEVLADLVDEARRLSRLVDGLLSLARADAGQQIALRELWLDRVVLDTVSRVANANPTASLRLERVDPVRVQGDSDRLTEVIVNLLDNALKYAPPGSPITCAVFRGDGSARVTVADRGIGISALDLPHVFARFYRADKARRRDEGGTGLGLSIAAWIVAQHHGHIDVRSVEGAGTTFTVTLPAVVTAN